MNPDALPSCRAPTRRLRAAVLSRRLAAVNLPNSITVSRLILTAVFVGAFTIGGPAGFGVALGSFLTAAFSDFLDGYLARKLNLVTPLGKLLDPIADKVLVASAFVFLGAHPLPLCPAWVGVVILAREFLVTGLRQIAVEQGRVIASDWSGKWKTIFQLAFCLTALTGLFLESIGAGHTLPGRLTRPPSLLLPVFLWLALALPAISGAQYAWSSRHLLRTR